ncbi:hypothetical protein OAL14_07235 [Gammaproteobacteria bacterium]|nr:hypothetical protein [Gammaproteobacteria bacterium]
MKSKAFSILFIMSLVFNLLLLGFLARSYSNSEERFGSPRDSQE